jgi:hypothetical protein
MNEKKNISNLNFERLRVKLLFFKQVGSSE